MKAPQSNQAPSAPPMEAGLQKARCYLMAYVGTQSKEWQGETKHRPEVVLGFLYPEHNFDFYGDGELLPYSKCKPYTFNMGRKANLRKVLEAWRGSAFSEDYPDFDLTKVLGTSVLHNIIHNEDGDKFFISDYIKIKAQSDCPEIDPAMIVQYDIREHDQVAFDKLPKWIQNMAMDSPEWAETMGTTTTMDNVGIPDDGPPADMLENQPSGPIAPAPTEEQDDIPF